VVNTRDEINDSGKKADNRMKNGVDKMDNRHKRLSGD
jgi:hypothetical protein